MRTRPASERIDVRASRMSSLRISLSGPSNGLAERPTAGGFDDCPADIWSVMNPPSSRLSLIVAEVWDKGLDRETIECQIAHPASGMHHVGPSRRLRSTPGRTRPHSGGRHCDHRYEHHPSPDRVLRSAVCPGPDAGTAARSVPG